MYILLYVGIFIALLILPSVLILVNYKSKIKCYVLIICIPLLFSIMFTCLTSIDINAERLGLKQLKMESTNIINKYEEYLEDWTNCINNHPATENSNDSYYLCPEDHSNSKQLDYNITIYENTNQITYRINPNWNYMDGEIFAGNFWTLQDKGASFLEKSIENFEYLKSKIGEINIFNLRQFSLGNGYYVGGISLFGGNVGACIGILVVNLIALCIGIVSIGLRINYSTKNKNKKALEFAYETESVNTFEEIKKPTWEEITQEDKKKYFDYAIKELYEKQLANNTQLTRQQKALKRDCIANNEFYLEDLTDEEKIETEKLAKEKYDSKDIIIEKTKIVIENKKLLTKSFKWWIISLLSSRNDIYGSCPSITGITDTCFPLRVAYSTLPTKKKKLVCCYGKKGFEFSNEDIIEFKLISSNSAKECYILKHKTGCEFMLNLTPVGVNVLNMVVGMEKLKSTAK